MSQKETMLHGWRFNQPLSELAKAIEMTSAVYGEGLKLVEYLIERIRRAENPPGPVKYPYGDGNKDLPPDIKARHHVTPLKQTEAKLEQQTAQEVSQDS